MGDASGSETDTCKANMGCSWEGWGEPKPEQITKENPNPTKNNNNKKGSKSPPKPNDKNFLSSPNKRQKTFLKEID